MTGDRWGDLPHGWTLTSGPTDQDGMSPVRVSPPGGPTLTRMVPLMPIMGYAKRRRHAVAELRAELEAMEDLNRVLSWCDAANVATGVAG